MSTFPFTFQIKEDIRMVDGNAYELVCLTVTFTTGKFPRNSQYPNVLIYDSSNEVLPFHIKLSGNSKELEAYFTTDGLNVFSGNATISFGVGSAFNGSFTNQNISQLIQTLPSGVVPVTYPKADNTWLASLT